MQELHQDDKIKELLRFQIRRKITNLYKQFLFIIEDIQASKTPQDSEVFQRNRKRILDFGNDTAREIEDYLKNLDIKLK